MPSPESPGHLPATAGSHRPGVRAIVMARRPAVKTVQGSRLRARWDADTLVTSSPRGDLPVEQAIVVNQVLTQARPGAGMNKAESGPQDQPQQRTEGADNAVAGDDPGAVMFAEVQFGTGIGLAELIRGAQLAAPTQMGDY